MSGLSDCLVWQSDVFRCLTMTGGGSPPPPPPLPMRYPAQRVSVQFSGENFSWALGRKISLAFRKEFSSDPLGQRP